MGAIVVLEALLHVIDLVLGDLEAGPAVPLEAGGLAQTAESGDEAAGRHGEVVVAVLGALDGDGEAVGQQQQAAWRGLAAILDDTGHCVGEGESLVKPQRTDPRLARCA